MAITYDSTVETNQDLQIKCIYIPHYFLSFYRSFISVINTCIYYNFFFRMKKRVTKKKRKKKEQKGIIFLFFVYTHLSLSFYYFANTASYSCKDAETASHILTFPGEPEGRRLSCIHLRWETVMIS